MIGVYWGGFEALCSFCSLHGGYCYRDAGFVHVALLHVQRCGVPHGVIQGELEYLYC